MGRVSKDVKVDVTVNGSGFDTPSEIVIEDEGEIPYCTMVFPGGIRSRYKILKRDKVRVYIGLDDLPEYPTFLGYQVEETGIRETTMEFSGALYRADKDFRRVLDTDNFDNWEVGNALETILREVNSLGFLNTHIETTNPPIYIPKDIRYERGLSKYALMTEFRDLATYSIDAIRSEGYTFFVHGDDFYFRKIPDPRTADPWVEIAYGDTLLSINQSGSSTFPTNKQTVKGKNEVFGTYQNDHRIAIDSLLEDDPISDTNILDNGEATEIARAKVISNMIPEVPLMVDSPLLLEMVPKASVIEITGAPYGLSGKYLQRNKTITVSGGMFQVVGSVSTPVDVVANVIAKFLGLDRDLPLTDTPTGTAIA